MIQADSIRELVKVRDRLEAWKETAERSVEANPNHPAIRFSNSNLVTIYEALI
jgi:hypothetical protein